MNLRVTIYWLFTLMTWVLCLFFTGANDHTDLQPATQLSSYFQSNQNAFYFSNNLFHLNVIGQLKLSIKSSEIQNDLTVYDALVIENYYFKPNTEISLNWSIKEQPHQVKLNQNQLSINHIDFKTKDPSEISDLHLLITAQQELGAHQIVKDEIKFQSIRLDYMNKQNQLLVNFSEWNDFTPVEFSSINGYTNQSDLNMKGMVMRVCAWLIIAVLMFYLCRIRGVHLLLTIAMAWVFCGYFFITNHIKQNNQISQSFANNQKQLNSLDSDALELAQLISQSLQNLKTEFASTDRLVLFGQNTFDKLRLKHHLKDFNLGMYSNIRTLIHDPETPEMTFILVGKQLRYCQKIEKLGWLNSKVKLIELNQNFCILKKP